MLNYKNWIVKKEKPFLKRYGAHHAGIALAAIVPIFFILGPTPAAIAYGVISNIYYTKEKRENGAKTEIFDVASPIIIGAITLAVLKYLDQHGTISHLFF